MLSCDTLMTKNARYNKSISIFHTEKTNILEYFETIHIDFLVKLKVSNTFLSALTNDQPTFQK